MLPCEIGVLHYVGCILQCKDCLYVSWTKASVASMAALLWRRTSCCSFSFGGVGVYLMIGFYLSIGDICFLCTRSSIPAVCSFPSPYFLSANVFVVSLRVFMIYLELLLHVYKCTLDFRFGENIQRMCGAY